MKRWESVKLALKEKYGGAVSSNTWNGCFVWTGELKRDFSNKHARQSTWFFLFNRRVLAICATFSVATHNPVQFIVWCDQFNNARASKRFFLAVSTSSNWRELMANLHNLCAFNMSSKETSFLVDGEETTGC